MLVPVSIVSTAAGTERDYFNSSGTLVHSNIRYVEQDTFSANGVTLTGTPFVNEQHLQFDSAGNLIHDYEVGVIERVPLPDGTTFLSAGRIDFVAHPGVSLVITPDVGHSGDIAAFCAALAG